MWCQIKCELSKTVLVYVHEVLVLLVKSHGLHSFSLPLGTPGAAAGAGDHNHAHKHRYKNQEHCEGSNFQASGLWKSLQLCPQSVDDIKHLLLWVHFCFEGTGSDFFSG